MKIEDKCWIDDFAVDATLDDLKEKLKELRKHKSEVYFFEIKQQKFKNYIKNKKAELKKS